MENDLMTKLLRVENDYESALLQEMRPNNEHNNVQQFLQIQLMGPFDQQKEDPLFPSTLSYDFQQSTRSLIELQRSIYDSNSQVDSYPLFGQLIHEDESILSEDSRKEGSTQGLPYFPQYIKPIFEMERDYVIMLSPSESAPSENSRIAIPPSPNSKKIKRIQPPKATETKNLLTGIKNLLKKRGKLIGWNFKNMIPKVQELILSKPSLSIDGFRTLLKDPDIGNHIRTYLRSNQFIMDVMTSNLEKKEIYFTYFSKLCSKMDSPDTIFKIK